MSRPHHYVFGHIWLRIAFLDNPMGVVYALMKRNDEPLLEMWEEIGARIEKSDGASARLSPTGLTCTYTKLNTNTVAIIVTLPPPVISPEAYFVGLVFRPERTELWGPYSAGPGLVRYITLELGSDIYASVKPKTALCEWSAENHVNFGDGPEATVDAFYSKLVEMFSHEPV